ncbi:MAG TPA: glycosyltransferase [Lunatimonas sp.]|nr:glycosyltransferase [Lunatimonas sp.]
MHLSNPGYLFSLSVVEAVYFGWLIMYISIMIYLYFRYNRIESKPHWTSQPVRVALIIPFRNESKNVQRLAGQLAKSVPNSWEIIWVDDHSEDSSTQLLVSWIKTHEIEGWKVLAAKGEGKKRALQTGILCSSSEIIVTTDADVILAQDAFAELILPFSDPEVKLVAGPVISQQGPGVFDGFQQIEWASVLLVTGAFFEAGRPLMCSGANLAFRKETFLQVDGYKDNEHLLSGDDEFLLKKIAKTYGPSSTVFLPTRKSLVFVPPANLVSEFLQQRVRWGSKWRSHRSLSHAISAMFAVFFTVLPLFSLLFFLAGSLSGWVLGIIWIGRFMCDYYILSNVLKVLALDFHWFYFPVTSLIHPGYVLAVCLGVIRGGFSWKGRKSKLFH